MTAIEEKLEYIRKKIVELEQNMVIIEFRSSQEGELGGIITTIAEQINQIQESLSAVDKKIDKI